MPKKKTPKIIDKDLLNDKGTKELLSYLRRLHQCEESFALSDMDVDPSFGDNRMIYFKDTPQWKLAYDNVKSILRDREHIKK